MSELHETHLTLNLGILGVKKCWIHYNCDLMNEIDRERHERSHKITVQDVYVEGDSILWIINAEPMKNIQYELKTHIKNEGLHGYEEWYT